ncbi:SPA2L protein, partial [Amia calva]|nr:SPA2L protein [Amia calva]
MSKRGKRDLCEEYRVAVQRRVEEGLSELVCQDASLIDTTQKLLLQGEGQELHSYLKNDAFQLISTTLLSAPSLHLGLNRLRKAFEVLELATLNLYLCPWRQEFKIIKTFSGVYTHYLKPTFSVDSLLQLFQKMGYRERDRHQLELASMPPPDTLLRVACGFFVARCECDLLQGMAKKLIGVKVSADDLIQERRKSRSLDEAVSNLKHRMASSRKAEHSDWSTGGKLGPDTEIDLYTAEGMLLNGEDHQHGIASQISTSSLTPRKERESLQSQGEHSTTASTVTWQLQNTSLTNAEASPPSSRGDRHSDGKGNDTIEVCKCVKKRSAYLYKCLKCQRIHCRDCNILEQCDGSKHAINLTDVEDERLISAVLEELGSVKRSSLISTESCPKTEKGVEKSLLPGYGNSVEQAPEWVKHSCITDGRQPHLACITCCLYHDHLCEEGKACLQRHQTTFLESDHTKRKELTRKEPQYRRHSCNSDRELPSLACTSCFEFHSFLCLKAEGCLKMHDVKSIDKCSATAGCTSPGYYVCMNCCTVHCKNCWFKRPMECTCG